MFYFYLFIAAVALTALLTLLIKKLAGFLKVLDYPDTGQLVQRKIHVRATPLLGGVAVFIAYFSLLFCFSGRFLAGDLNFHHLLGFFLGALFLMIGGFLDDKYKLKSHWQFLFPLAAIAALIAGGVEISKLTNPLGGYFSLNNFFWLSAILIALWLLGMMYTTKLLDGVDGLVSGVSAIGGLVIFLFTLTTRYYQPDIALAAWLLAATSFGFLIFNFYPAKIFLGEGGSLLLGYILGVLAIISGSKIAIALLIMGIPVLDVAWTIIRRLARGKNPFRFADRQHLHHRLLDSGLSQKQTVLVFYIFSLVFGLSGLFLQSLGKLWALAALVGLMFLMVVFLGRFRRSAIKKKIFSSLASKPKLLLHICCAPCGTYLTRDRLLPRYDVTWYFYNPNLCSRAEYDKRLTYVKLMAKKYSVPLLVEPYDHRVWADLIRGRENDLERGSRCHLCYRDRLLKTASLAKSRGFTFFSTTLLLSPYKDVAKLKAISRELAALNDVAFLEEDFQADNAYRHSQELAKELGIYRQKFCGCEYSLKN